MLDLIWITTLNLEVKSTNCFSFEMINTRAEGFGKVKCLITIPGLRFNKIGARMQSFCFRLFWIFNEKNYSKKEFLELQTSITVGI